MAGIEGNLYLNKKSQLKHLYVYNHECSKISESNLEKLLSSCHSLKRLSMIGIQSVGKKYSPEEEELGLLNHNMVKSICQQNYKTLEAIHLSGVEVKWILMIFENCLELREFSLVSNDLTEESANVLVNSLPPKIEKFGIYRGLPDPGKGPTPITDDHVEVLLRRCNKLSALNLSQYVESRVLKMVFCFQNCSDLL